MHIRLLAAAAAAGIGGILAGQQAPAATSAPTLDWTLGTPAVSPPPLAYAAGAYDPADNTFVMFGGVLPGGTLSGDTWVWNGSNWSRFSGGGGPAPRQQAAVAFSTTLQQFVLFGGEDAQGDLLGDTWAWNGASWCEVSAGSGLGGTCGTSSAQAPPPRAGATLAADATGDLVLYGGLGKNALQSEVDLGDTWQWNGRTWSQAHPASSPPARSGAAAAYNPVDRTTVLFGGQEDLAPGRPSLLADTWLWDGHSWTQAQPSSSPPARSLAVSDYFGAAGGPVVSGGEGAAGALADTWMWSGGTWIQTTTVGQPLARMGAAGAYDSATGQLVVFGGAGSTGSGPLASDGVTGLARLLPATQPSSTTTTLPPPAGPSTTLAGRPPPPTTTTVPARPAKKPAVTSRPPATTVPATSPLSYAALSPPADSTARVQHETPVRPSARGTPTATKAFLLGLAVLIPVATYLGIILAARLRNRKRAGAPGNPG